MVVKDAQRRDVTRAATLGLTLQPGATRAGGAFDSARGDPVLASPAVPAAQTFGAALHRAVVAERRPIATLGDPMPTIIPAAPSVHAVVADVAPLDVTQPRWPEAMMARIEQVREAQAAPGSFADTRIRLHPDALGPIEVAFRREGEAVHVHLTAADAATVKLLADAQSRLAELAEAKGLKLTQSAVDAGAGNPGNERRQPPPSQAAYPVRPATTRELDLSSDTRLA